MSSALEVLNADNLGVAQSGIQPKPPTIASTTTIAPTTRFTFISGTVAIATITPPMDGYHELVLCFTTTTPETTVTTGNIKTAYAPVQNRPVTLCFVPQEAKYYVMTVA